MNSLSVFPKLWSSKLALPPLGAAMPWVASSNAGLSEPIPRYKVSPSASAISSATSASAKGSSGPPPRISVTTIVASRPGFNVPSPHPSGRANGLLGMV